MYPTTPYGGFMAGNRKAAEKFILDNIDKIAPNSGNKELYQRRFKSMSDRQFDQFMTLLHNGELTLQIKMPTLEDANIDVNRNIKIGKELGYDFFQQLRLTDAATGQTYTTPQKYLILDLPLRRQAQLLVKKMSIPEDNTVRDTISGQPAGASKGSKVSFPELQVLYALGLDRSIEEMIKVRGGDEIAFNAMNRSIVQNGGASLDSIRALNSNTKSTESLSAYLTAMHLDNNLKK